MSNPVPPTLRSFLARTAPEPTDVQREMADYGRESGFPIIGPVAGGTCFLLSRLVDARTVFEFGSGFGYSASWFGRALPPDGRIVLTDHDPANLERAEDFLERSPLTAQVAFRTGDAVATVADEPGPFDVVLLDHEKHRYVEGFEAVRDKVAPGGLVVADNILAGAVSFESVRSRLMGPDPDSDVGNDDGPVDTAADGIAAYLARLESDPAFESIVLPVDEGLAVSVRDLDE